MVYSKCKGRSEIVWTAGRKYSSDELTYYWQPYDQSERITQLHNNAPWKNSYNKKKLKRTEHKCIAVDENQIMNEKCDTDYFVVCEKENP